MAAAAALVVGVLAAMATKVDHVVALLPPVPGTRAGVAFAALCAVGLLVAGLRRLSSASRCRTRRAALEEAMPSAEVSRGIRHRALISSLAELGTRVRLPGRFSIVADERGLSFWSGGRRPRRVHEILWREVRSIRSDRVIVGSGSIPVAVLRIRRGGSSLDLPLLLAGERATSFVLVDAPFFATVRSWKARHRAALAAEGLELPPLTAPIPVITSAQLAAAGR
ncbi:hypothetical protein GE115_08140 [Agromyces sp. CFH 90414]|uniref:Uncharacterized protein n=1 Tax=Agromyces agglutinans TaxID=2662258 RepID=A0A6I2FBL7_9MICO|nr:hypothetical protein [Agromyces agglutinans]MRG59836.1 hypothetical protein [Agromyces agglutinans]